MKGLKCKNLDDDERTCSFWVWLCYGRVAKYHETCRTIAKQNHLQGLVENSENWMVSLTWALLRRVWCGRQIQGVCLNPSRWLWYGFVDTHRPEWRGWKGTELEWSFFSFQKSGPFFFVAFHNVVEGGGGLYWLWSVLVTWYSRFFRCTKLVGSEVGWSLNCLFVFDIIMWFRPGGDLAYSKVIPTSTLEWDFHVSFTLECIFRFLICLKLSDRSESLSPFPWLA